MADVHLGYGWAQRRRGELGPLADFHSRDKLFDLCRELSPSYFVFVGDLVHAPRPCPEERTWIEETLSQLASCAKLIAVRGNHDRAFPQEFGHLAIDCVRHWSNDRITAIHGDRFDVAVPDSHTLVAGHLHPSLPVRDAAGAGRKIPVFLASQACIIMPAFSPFAGGFDLASGLPPEWLPCFRNETIEACAVTGTRAVCLGSLERARERLFSEPSSAARYQRRYHPN